MPSAEEFDDGDDQAESTPVFELDDYDDVDSFVQDLLAPAEGDDSPSPAAVRPAPRASRAAAPQPAAGKSSSAKQPQVVVAAKKATRAIIQPTEKKLAVPLKPELVLDAALAARMSRMSDSRTLTAKGIKTLQNQWSEENKARTRDGLVRGLVNAGKAKFGTTHIYGSKEELDRLVVGLRTPSIAFEYLIGNDIFPLGCLLMIAGQWGTCKSMLLYEFFRWCWVQSGLNIHTDTEAKFDADFAYRVMRAAESDLPMISTRAVSLEKMQAIITYYIKELKAQFTGTKEAPGPGKTVPVCFGVDSLVGAATEELQEKLLKEGSMDRAFPLAALKNSGFLTNIKPAFDAWPFTLIIVNHLKEKTDASGNKSNFTPGGQAFNFHESFEIHTSLWKRKILTTSFSGVGVKLHCAKNSFGPTLRQIKTRFLWWKEDDENGVPQDFAIWDWDWSVCVLLLEATGLERTRLQERGLLMKAKSPSADVECMANFPALGMGKDEYLPFQEVGQMIHNNPQVSTAIRDALGIKRRFYLDQSLDKFTAAHKKKLK
jgi:hypothetical protein